MRQIQAYHPKVHVQDKRGREHVVTADLPDFEQDEEVLKKMAESLGVETAGEVVEALQKGVGSPAKQSLEGAGISAARVEKPSQPSNGCKVFSHDERVV